MKYIIPENKLDKIIFKYLDLNLKRLEKRKPMYFDGVLLAYPDEKYGILRYKNDGTLYIYDELIKEISSNFRLKKSDSKLVIGRWVSDRYQFELTNTVIRKTQWYAELAIDTN